MVPESFPPFFNAMAEGGATLLGVLFVGVSLCRGGDGAGAVTEPALLDCLADALLLGMLGGFVVSSFALIPGVNVGYVALPLGVLAFVMVFRVLFGVLRAHRTQAKAPRRRFRLRTLGPTVTGIANLRLPSLRGRPPDPESARHGRGALARHLRRRVLRPICLLRAWMLVGGAEQGLRAGP